MIVQKRIEKVKNYMSDVLDHPLCAKLEETKHYFIAIFPYEINGMAGIRVDKKQGTSKSLVQLLINLEKQWAHDVNKQNHSVPIWQ